MPKVAVGILIKREKNHINEKSDEISVLLCQRPKNASYPLKWEFPGGKIEEGESAKEALIREIFEELNVQVESFSTYFQRVNHYPDGRNFDVSYFIVSQYSGELENLEFEAIEWVHISQLTTFDILEGNKDIVDMLLETYA